MFTSTKMLESLWIAPMEDLFVLAFVAAMSSRVLAFLLKHINQSFGVTEG